jgi:hypothetical protein
MWRWGIDRKRKKGSENGATTKTKGYLYIYIYIHVIHIYIYNFSREKMGTWRLICKIFGVATPLGLFYRTKHPVVGALHELPSRCSNARRALCRNPTENATPRSWLCYRLPQVDGEYL